MIYQIKKILTEDSELMQNVRAELENSLSSANARGTEIEKLTKTPSPHVSDKPPVQEDALEESHHHHHHPESPVDEHKEFLKKLKKIQANNNKDNPVISTIYESVILAKQKFLSGEAVINKSAANELSKEGLANVNLGSNAVANSPINSLKRGADAATGTITESSDSNFGKVHIRSTEGTPLVQSTSTQAAIEEKGKMERSTNKKIIAGVTEANPSNILNNRKKDGIHALISIQKAKMS